MGGPENGNFRILYVVKISLRRWVGGSKKPQNNHTIKPNSCMYPFSEKFVIISVLDCAVRAAPWARAANFVKKPPLIVNLIYLELKGF